MNNGRPKAPRHVGSAGTAVTTGNTGSGGSSGTAGSTGSAGSVEEPSTRAVTSRGPWAVLCAVVTVVLGPAAATASALDQANAAPMHDAVRADQTHAYIPSDASRRRVA